VGFAIEVELAAHVRPAKAHSQEWLCYLIVNAVVEARSALKRQ
jgi:hypothetical protein